MKHHILDMFTAIDSKAIEQLPAYFNDGITYERPGFPIISGIEDLLDFYRNRRIIAEGKHTVESLVIDDHEGVAIGVFKGRLKNGAEANERFADVYRFNDGKISHRTTYFFQKAI